MDTSQVKEMFIYDCRLHKAFCNIRRTSERSTYISYPAVGTVPLGSRAVLDEGKLQKLRRYTALITGSIYEHEQNCILNKDFGGSKRFSALIFKRFLILTNRIFLT
jgi:hypothetical protein